MLEFFNHARDHIFNLLHSQLGSPVTPRFRHWNPRVEDAPNIVSTRYSIALARSP